MQLQENDKDGSFAKKIEIFSHDYLKCCLSFLSAEDPKRFFVKKFILSFISSSQLLEDFLDYHGAKNNKNWYYYRELSAAVRHLSLASYSQTHILNRITFYDLPVLENFVDEGKATLDFLVETILKMAPEILAEAHRLGIPVPKEIYSPVDFPSVTTKDKLEYDIDDDNKDLQKESIVKIASEFLNIADDLDHYSFYEPYDINGIRSIVPGRINEVEIRHFEMLVHNLQSSFDTYVIHGGYRFGNRKLKQLRGLFSVVFHLLQIIGRLLHFYERHLHDAGYKSLYKKSQEKLSLLVDPDLLLEHTINYGLYFVCYFLTNGKDFAKEILNENIERSSIAVGIPVSLGFHSRPSLLVAKIVQHYGGQVELCVGTDRFDASNVLDIQWAGGKIQKENTKEVIFEGDVRALKDIKILAGVNYGEDTMGKGVPLPKELKYLK
ncbi:MAG: HPr family phosphocarrier protein [Desulfobacterium sp.]|nr:HPr family phosphocarrier protein [Desulfobacterium sp.]MBU3947933.1 HPr family phosphocarrier protein [Pseudomonadota bacterium]MBU4035804.1 HPr family phosphocarrier protein [Pseudomonadota bacterium]